MVWEFLRQRGPLHTLVTIQIAFSRVSPGTDAIRLAAFGLLHPQWLPVHSVLHVCVCHVHTRVGELTSKCEAKVPFFSVSHNPLPCVSSQLSLWCSCSLLVGAVEV